jgi:hypothetical protein
MNICGYKRSESGRGSIMPKTIISVEKTAHAKELAPLTLHHGARVNKTGFTIVINPKVGHVMWF